MEWLFRLDRVLQAALTAGLFWMFAGFAYSGVLEDEAITRKARALEFLIDVLLVGLFGRIGTTVLFVVLGVCAGIWVLRRGNAA